MKRREFIKKTGALGMTSVLFPVGAFCAMPHEDESEVTYAPGERYCTQTVQIHVKEHDDATYMTDIVVEALRKHADTIEKRARNGKDKSWDRVHSIKNGEAEKFKLSIGGGVDADVVAVQRWEHYDDWHGYAVEPIPEGWEERVEDIEGGGIRFIVVPKDSDRGRVI